MKTWLTADWHLGETRMELMGRPFVSPHEQLAVLAHNHNSVVKPEDTVIVVGDVCNKDAPEWLKFVGTHFNGRKLLIRGNHDRGFTDDQLRPYFDQIIGDGGGYYQMLGGVTCYITHYPTEGVQNAFNIVGHIHAAWKYQLNMLNVGVDVHHFRPVDADKIQFHLDAVTKFYDNDVWVAYDERNASYRGKRGKPGTYFRP